jgi:hypothetical protein
MIQDLKGSIRVFCRVRPHIGGMDGDGELDVVEATIDEDGVANGLMVAVDKGQREGVVQKGYSFDRCFGPEATQGGIYEECSALIRCGGAVEVESSC